jgi:WD40 repeat protein
MMSAHLSPVCRFRLRILIAAGAALLAVAAQAEPYRQAGDGPVPDNLLNKSADGSRELRRSEASDYDVEVWDTAAHKKLGSITGLSGVVNVANISPDGTKVVTAERTGIVGLWDAATGKQIRLLRGHEDQIHDARFSPDGKTIASGARDGTARTWDAETGAQIAVHRQQGGSYVDTVSFSPDGKWVMSAGNGWVEIWNAKTGDVHSSTKVGPEDDGAFSTDARFSPDGKAMLVVKDGEKPDPIPLMMPLPLN